MSTLKDPSLVAAMAAYVDAGRPPTCPSCGAWPGPRLPDCTDSGWDHGESCTRLRMAVDVCADCRPENPSDGWVEAMRQQQRVERALLLATQWAATGKPTDVRHGQALIAALTAHSESHDKPAEEAADA